MFKSLRTLASKVSRSCFSKWTPCAVNALKVGFVSVTSFTIKAKQEAAFIMKQGSFLNVFWLVEMINGVYLFIYFYFIVVIKKIINKLNWFPVF